MPWFCAACKLQHDQSGHHLRQADPVIPVYFLCPHRFPLGYLRFRFHRPAFWRAARFTVTSKRHHVDHCVGIHWYRRRSGCFEPSQKPERYRSCYHLGLLTALTIYVFVTLLSMGVVSTEQLATYQNPSMAKVLTEILGPWGKYIIGGGLLISVCGAFLSWTVLASEAPYLGARDKMFPISFAKQNEAGSPVNSLLLTNSCIQVSLIFVMFAGSTYDTLLAIASEMILVPYFLVGAYTLKLAIERKDRGSLFVVGLCASLYGLWLLYASGLNYLLLSALLYVPGLYFYVKAKREQQTRPFVGKEMTAASLLTAAACVAVGMLWKGMI